MIAHDVHERSLGVSQAAELMRLSHILGSFQCESVAPPYRNVLSNKADWYKVGHCPQNPC